MCGTSAGRDWEWARFLRAHEEVLVVVLENIHVIAQEAKLVARVLTNDPSNEPLVIWEMSSEVIKGLPVTSEQAGNSCMWGWELFVSFFPHVSVLKGSEIQKEFWKESSIFVG